MHRVFDADFQEKLIAEVRACMRLAAEMQDSINSPDFISHKDDLSPVTAADHAVQARLEKFLRAEIPEYEFMGEESLSKKISTSKIFWLCDPIDGTREYANGGTDFAIILALIENNHPVFGLIGAPVTGEIAYQTALDKVVIRHKDDRIEEIIKTPVETKRLIVGRGRSKDMEAFSKRFGVMPDKTIIRPSALKFINLLRGEADYYIRAGDVSEWDIAAGEALLFAMGGHLFQFDGVSRIEYGRSDTDFILNGIYASR